MKKIRIAAAGDNCMDVYDKENKAFPGGNPVNVAVYVARLGGASAYIGPVGTDAYGKQMMDAIQGKGVDVSRMKILEGTTAVTHVEIVDGDRVLGDYEEGVMADFKLDEEDIDFLSSNSITFRSRYISETTIYFFSCLSNSRMTSSIYGFAKQNSFSVFISFSIPSTLSIPHSFEIIV